jgi:hypothetical protein
VLGWLLLLLSMKPSFWMPGLAGWLDTLDRFSTLIFYLTFSNMRHTKP